MLRRLVPVVAVALLSVAVAGASADAAVRSKRNHGVRLTLDGRHLTATIVADFGTADELQGHRVQAACGVSLDLRDDHVFTARRWPAPARTLRFTFRRDISRRASWCVLEETGGSDIAVARFFPPEPRRLVAQDRTPTGSQWKLLGWRAAFRQPCDALRLDGDMAARSCFDGEAGREARLAATVHRTTCSGDLFVHGVTGRATAQVRITLGDGTTVDAGRYPRPKGSRVRAQYFLAVLPGTAHVTLVEALDADGALVGRVRLGEDPPDC